MVVMFFGVHCRFFLKNDEYGFSSKCFKCKQEHRENPAKLFLHSYLFIFKVLKKIESRGLNSGKILTMRLFFPRLELVFFQCGPKCTREVLNVSCNMKRLPTIMYLLFKYLQLSIIFYVKTVGVLLTGTPSSSS